MVCEPMVYECETCEAVLTPGLTVCPRCGQVFDEPVPDDAVADQTVFADTEETERPPRLNTLHAWGEPDLDTDLAHSEAALPSSPLLSGSPELGRGGLSASRLPVHRMSRPWPAGETAAMALVLIGLAGLVWFGSRYWIAPPDTSKPLLAALPAPPTDLAAHPQYASNMAVFVQKLRATGVGAEWPAFRSNDVLLITPQARVPEPPAAWTSDMYRRLAQGIYGEFAQNRYESGFSETDTTACFVIVTSASGQVRAVDFMGKLQ